MTILNLQSDGLPPVLITLALVVAKEKNIHRDALIELCAPTIEVQKDKDGEKSGGVRARATLARWTSLGLFLDEEGQMKLNFSPLRGETTDSFTQRLPEICCRLLMQSEHVMPLWPSDGSISEEHTGRAADFCRGLAWCLAQDIYTLPSSYNLVDDLIRSQIQPGRFIILNDTRWSGLRSWSRYLGFASGDDSRLLFDPTVAIRAQLKQITSNKEFLAADEFVERLAERLPVIDKGRYRIEVEQVLKQETWRPPGPNQLSSSLSFALRRLQKQGLISLEMRADAGSRLSLSRQNGRTWESFTHIRFLKEAV
jgi:hypothetical protein